ncbi:unnamed protein product [Rhodiola kirilowii]
MGFSSRQEGLCLETELLYLKPCQGCDWREDCNALLKPKWYATNQVLPDGRSVVVGGLSQFSYVFVPRLGAEDSAVRKLPFLEETMTSIFENNNLYPFVHLGPDGNLFIFANDRAILLDYVNNKVLRKYPVFPGGFSHNYPSTGSSALLPLKLNGANQQNLKGEVLICGGTYPHAFRNSMAKRRRFIPASKLCGRLTFTDQSPAWKIEEMPMRRIMGDMILLPTGDVLIVNGAGRGAAGWDNARSPVLNPVLYKVNAGNGKERFEVLAGSEVPRLYHSSAHLLPDGRVLIGGSNPNNRYNFSTLYPTELSLEAFYPPYLTTGKTRPEITAVKPGLKLVHNQKISVGFQVGSKQEVGNDIYVTMVAPSFTTHSLSMHQRVLALQLRGVRKVTHGNFVVDGEAPASGGSRV